jgi:hypothetical protein
MTAGEREAFARGVSVGCAFGYAVGSEHGGDSGSTVTELLQLLDDLDQLRKLCGASLTPVELVRSALIERLAEASAETDAGCA